MIKEGKLTEALRAAVALLQQNTSNTNTWYELANLCLQLDARDAAVNGLRSACREFAENGNLPMAIVCVRNLEEAGENAQELKKHIASLYGKDSKRVRNRAMPVPPLPSTVDEESLINFKLDKKFLLTEADKILTLADESAKMARGIRTKEAPVPFFPLFGSLSEENFIELIGCFRSKRFYKDEMLIKQGETARDFHLVARGEIKVFIAEKFHDDSGRTQAMRFKHVATLGPGTLVGEMGIVAKTPRSANVQAVSSGVLLSASLESIEELAGRIPELADSIVAYCEVRLLENVMSASPILIPIENEAGKAKALKFFERIYVPSGEVIIREGQSAKGIYVIVSGEAGVTKLGETPKSKNMRESQTGHMIYITTLTAGDITGEISTVMKKPATATVHSITDTSLLFLPKDKLMEFTKAYPGVFQKIYEIVSIREKEIEEILAAKTTPADDFIE